MIERMLDAPMSEVVWGSLASATCAAFGAVRGGEASTITLYDMHAGLHVFELPTKVEAV